MTSQRRLVGETTTILSPGDHRVATMPRDVAGKGLPASLLMANLQATLRARRLFDATPAECSDDPISSVGGTARRNSLPVFRISTRKTIASATFNARQEIPFILTDDPEPVRLAEGGVALGVVEEFDFKEEP